MGAYSERGKEILNTVTSIIDQEATKGTPGLGKRVADIIADQFGGQQIYLPFDRERRDARIFAEYRGDNIHAIASKYRVSTNQVYKIVQRELAKRRQKQTLLPGVSIGARQ